MNICRTTKRCTSPWLARQRTWCALGESFPPFVLRTHPAIPSVGGDAHIAPPRPQARKALASLCEGGGAKRRRERYATAAPRHHAKGTFRAPARGTFAHGGKSTQKRRSNLRFENPLRAFARRLSCLSLPRERCAMQISPKCCIVSAPLPAAAFALKCRSTSFYRGRDQRQRRRRRDDPFDRTTKSNPRDRAVQTTDNHRI